MTIACVYFDIGSTLGTVTLDPLRLEPYPDIPKHLESLHGLGLRLGVISNVLEHMSNADIVAMLADATLDRWLNRSLTVVSTDGHGAKPGPRIFRHAAKLAGLEVGQCMFVGENLAEVIGARAAGMMAQLKPRPLAVDKRAPGETHGR